MSINLYQSIRRILPFALAALALTSTTILPSSNSPALVGQAEAQTQNCSICLDGITEQSQTLPCSHSFHQNCINEWLNRHNSCPLCRRAVGAMPRGVESMSDWAWDLTAVLANAGIRLGLGIGTGVAITHYLLPNHGYLTLFTTVFAAAYKHESIRRILR